MSGVSTDVLHSFCNAHKLNCLGAGVAMDAACNSLRQVAAGLQQCLEEEAPREKKYVLLLKGLACIAELKNQNQRLCEETERVWLSSRLMFLAWLYP